MTDELQLSAIEARTLGALIEKSMTTPEYYPLTLHALQAACNQKSNRNPVLQLGEKDVLRALDSLRDKKLAWLVDMAGSRVPKYRHAAAEGLGLDEMQVAVLCELVLRGPQTVAELRSHVARMLPAADLASVEAALRALCERTPALAQRGGRLPGQRGERYAHSLCGAPTDVADDVTATVEPTGATTPLQDARLAALEAEVAVLREAVLDLQARLPPAPGSTPPQAAAGHNAP